MTSTELPEDVLAYLKLQGRYGNAGAQDLLDKYEPPKWLPGDVVQRDTCISVRREDGRWLCSLADWKPTHVDAAINGAPATLMARGDKAVSA